MSGLKIYNYTNADGSGRIYLEGLFSIARQQYLIARSGQDLLGLVEGLEDLPIVVTVDADHVPAKGAPLVGQRLKTDDTLGPVDHLDSVAVDDKRQIV